MYETIAQIDGTSQYNHECHTQTKSYAWLMDFMPYAQWHNNVRQMELCQTHGRSTAHTYPGQDRMGTKIVGQHNNNNTLW